MPGRLADGAGDLAAGNLADCQPRPCRADIRGPNKMLDHITFSVTDIIRSKAFYDTALKPLGIRVLFEVTPEQSGGAHFMGYGEQRPYFWIAAGDGLKGRLHVAFTANDRATVDAFYRAAIAAGGKDFGARGL